MKALSKLERQLKDNEFADNLVASRDDRLEKTLAGILRDEDKLTRVIESLDDDTKVIVKEALNRRKQLQNSRGGAQSGTPYQITDQEPNVSYGSFGGAGGGKIMFFLCL